MKSFLRLRHHNVRLDFPRIAVRPASTRATPLQQTRKYTEAGFNNAMGKEKDKNAGYQLKVPKGTKDWDGKDMVVRDKIFSTITEVFKRHGAVTIDTLVNPAIVQAVRPPLTRFCAGPCLK